MLPFPGHLPVPALAETAPPAAGVQAGRRPPEGLGLDAGEDGATLHRPGPQSAIATNQLPNVTQITYTDNLTSSFDASNNNSALVDSLLDGADAGNMTQLAAVILTVLVAA